MVLPLAHLPYPLFLVSDNLRQYLERPYEHAGFVLGHFFFSLWLFSLKQGLHLYWSLAHVFRFLHQPPVE